MREVYVLGENLPARLAACMYMCGRRARVYTNMRYANNLVKSRLSQLERVVIPRV